MLRSLGVLAASIWLISTAHAMDCEKTKIAVAGKTIAECQASAERYSDQKKYGPCVAVTTWAMRWALGQSDCNKKVMDATLDVRLLKLKADRSAGAQAEFRNEMTLQKRFLEGVSAFCAAEYGSCQGTMWGPVSVGCPGDLYALRTAQAQMINESRLELPEVTKDFAANKASLPAPYLGYAKLVCAMPASVWKGGAVPPSCEDKVLSSLGFVPNNCN